MKYRLYYSLCSIKNKIHYFNGTYKFNKYISTCFIEKKMKPFKLVVCLSILSPFIKFLNKKPESFTSCCLLPYRLHYIFLFALNVLILFFRCFIAVIYNDIPGSLIFCYIIIHTYTRVKRGTT